MGGSDIAGHIHHMVGGKGMSRRRNVRHRNGWSQQLPGQIVVLPLVSGGFKGVLGSRYHPPFHVFLLKITNISPI